MLHSIKDINRQELTSDSLKEYLKIKDENPDCLILFQIGHFYLGLLDDAIKITEITGLTLGSRHFSGVGDVIQCGIPTDATLNIYIKQLLSRNYKICLCPEYLDENNVRHRRIIRTYTSGTIYESELLESSENNYILAISKDKEIYQLAYADVSTGQFYQTTGDITEIKLEVDKIEPCEILIPENLSEEFKKITSKYPTTFLERNNALKTPKTYIEDYCKINQKSFCTKFEDVVDYKITNYLMMDEITRQCLELTRTRRFLKKKGSILWFLNSTKTSMGARLLKKYLSEPLLSKDKIRERQDAVKELIENKNLVQQFEETMKNFCDLSRGCTKITNQTIYPKDLLSIAQNAKPIEKLSQLCKSSNSKLLKLDKDKIDEIIQFSNEIRIAIKENPSTELKKGDIIKEGYSANLDYLKEELEKIKKDIQNYQEYERKKLNISNLKILKSTVLGYYIEITSANAHKISSEYFKKQSNEKIARYTTDKLIALEKDYSSIIQKINDFEYELYCEIRLHAMEFVDIIRSLAKEIAQIDVLVSYARCAIEHELTCPSFNEDGIYIKDGFHPSLLKLNNEIIKNDTNINNGETIVLTGANMSGKSTYLKYNAIIALLSQIGSYVPAKNANLTLHDKIFVRQGSTDDIVNNNSSFMVEMNDLKFIIDNITDSSFVLLDEPAKSTNASEGGAIARAFCEYLLKNHCAKTMVATHNLELTKIEKTFPKRAINYVIGNANISEAIINDRKIKRGIINTSLALNTAILAKLPEEVIELAKKYT